MTVHEAMPQCAGCAPLCTAPPPPDRILSVKHANSLRHRTSLTDYTFQAMCRWTASTGGLTAYLREPNNAQAGKLVRMCMAIPLLPPELIRPAFQELRRFARLRDFYPTMEPFLDYVENTWLNDIGPEHISVYRRSRRTNNDQESYHRTLVDTLGQPHGNPWVWMDHYRDHEQQHRLRHLQAGAGYNPSRAKRSKYVLLDRRIANATRRLEARRITSIQFLRIASHLCHTTYNRVALRKQRALRAGEEDVVAPEVADLIPQEEMGRPPPVPPHAVDQLDAPEEDAATDSENEEDVDDPFVRGAGELVAESEARQDAVVLEAVAVAEARQDAAVPEAVAEARQNSAVVAVAEARLHQLHSEAVAEAGLHSEAVDRLHSAAVAETRLLSEAVFSDNVWVALEAQQQARQQARQQASRKYPWELTVFTV
ncbi:Protein RMD5-like protein [Frankliniella fusca]|uniref:Protein RMD5-like protein n=1 Tax=Frankliniella fusca TaxID=407009 RepID=A0AAE1LUI0_9NEOP|nr:Protein RMD5-like protein [Frankliniella fusca]